MWSILSTFFCDTVFAKPIVTNQEYRANQEARSELKSGSFISGQRSEDRSALPLESGHTVMSCEIEMDLCEGKASKKFIQVTGDILIGFFEDLPLFLEPLVPDLCGDFHAVIFFATKIRQ